MYNVQSLFHVPVPTEWDVQTEVVVVQPVCPESKECKDVLSLIHQTLPAAHRMVSSSGMSCSQYPSCEGWVYALHDGKVKC